MRRYDLLKSEITADLNARKFLLNDDGLTVRCRTQQPAGCKHHPEKPFDPEALMVLLKRL